MKNSELAKIRQSHFQRKRGLKSQLIAAFLIMGVIISVVGGLGNMGTFQLSRHLYEISEVRLPSIVGLQMIDYGLREIQTGELALLNARLSEAARQEQLGRFDGAWQQIKAGYDKYKPLPRTAREDKLWRQFLSKKEQWQQQHESFRRLYEEFEKKGIFSPNRRLLNLSAEGKGNSPEMAAAKTASMLLEQMNVQVFTLNRPAFISAEAVLQKIIQENEKIAAAAREAADRSVRETRLWVGLGTMAGLAIATILAIALTGAIAKPFSRLIRDTIDSIVSFSSQLASTVEEQERLTSEQATYVNQTTTILEELGISSQQCAASAESTASGAQKTLILARQGTAVVGPTLEGMTELKHKVEAISEQIVQLSEQTRQIGTISTLVGNVANQTNMLALNAAVEAARAGDRGKGFAVVAAEIRKLADRSRTSAQKINVLVADIQLAINSTVIATEQGTKTVDYEVQLVQKMADFFIGVASALDRVVIDNQEISLIAQQQAVTINQVANAMNNINMAAQQTATGISQTKFGTQQLNEVAQNLRFVA